MNQETKQPNVEKEEDIINPSHYKQGTVECFEAIKSALTEEELRGYIKGNAIKYIWRERHKQGIDSIKKAMWYLDKLLEVEAEKSTGLARANSEEKPKSVRKIMIELLDSNEHLIDLGSGYVYTLDREEHSPVNIKRLKLDAEGNYVLGGYLSLDEMVKESNLAKIAKHFLYIPN